MTFRALAHRQSEWKIKMAQLKLLTQLLALHNGSSALDINRSNGEKVELKGKKLPLTAIMGKGMQRL